MQADLSVSNFWALVTQKIFEGHIVCIASFSIIMHIILTVKCTVNQLYWNKLQENQKFYNIYDYI